MKTDWEVVLRSQQIWKQLVVLFFPFLAKQHNFHRQLEGEVWNTEYSWIFNRFQYWRGSKHFRNSRSSEHIWYEDEAAAWGMPRLSLLPTLLLHCKRNKRVVKSGSCKSILHNLLSLQICPYLLSEKSMRKSPPPSPPRARAISLSSRSPCTIPIRWRSRTNLYTWDLQEGFVQNKIAFGRGCCCWWVFSGEYAR